MLSNNPFSASNEIWIVWQSTCVCSWRTGAEKHSARHTASHIPCVCGPQRARKVYDKTKRFSYTDLCHVWRFTAKDEQNLLHIKINTHTVLPSFWEPSFPSQCHTGTRHSLVWFGVFLFSRPCALWLLWSTYFFLFQFFFFFFFWRLNLCQY